MSTNPTINPVSVSASQDPELEQSGEQLLLLRSPSGPTVADDTCNGKGQTFRKRRLSLILQNKTDGTANPSVNEGEDDVDADEDIEDDDDDYYENDDGEEEDDTQSHTLHINASEDFHSPISFENNGHTNTTTLHSDSNHSSGGGSGGAESDEKAHTFRKRRLSLTTTKTATTATTSSTAAVPYSTSLSPSSANGGGGGKSAFRRSSIDSHSSIASSSICSHDTSNNNNNHNNGNNTNYWISRTLHAGELIGTDGTLPPSPAHGPSFSTHFLYQTAASRPSTQVIQVPPPPPPALELGTTATATNSSQSQSLHPTLNGHVPAATANETRIPKWKRRHTFDARDSTDHHHKLPFSRDVVGTYSCHGVEPVYNDVYEELDDDHNNNMPHMAALPVTVAKINQDRGGVVCPYRNHPRTALFAVYDGHGHGGELVSQFALYEIQRRLEKHPLFDVDIERSMKETFLAVDDALIDEPSIDPMFAGTTACVVLLQNQRLTIANAGDSRAVCARRKPAPPMKFHVDPSATSTDTTATTVTAAASASLFPYVAIDLSFDQNPDVPMEMARIQNAGGFVSLPPGPGLSARVWLDPRCTQIGLAMSRSIGDHAISTVGVIAEPVVTYHDITEDDEFFIVASDGVWEFLDSTEAVNIVGNNIHRGSTKACQALIEAAAARWYEEEGAYRDDITAIVVRLKELWKKVENGKKLKSKR